MDGNLIPSFSDSQAAPLPQPIAAKPTGGKNGGNSKGFSKVLESTEKAVVNQEAGASSDALTPEEKTGQEAGSTHAGQQMVMAALFMPYQMIAQNTELSASANSSAVLPVNTVAAGGQQPAITENVGNSAGAMAGGVFAGILQQQVSDAGKTQSGPAGNAAVQSLGTDNQANISKSTKGQTVIAQQPLTGNQQNGQQPQAEPGSANVRAPVIAGEGGNNANNTPPSAAQLPINEVLTADTQGAVDEQNASVQTVAGMNALVGVQTRVVKGSDKSRTDSASYTKNTEENKTTLATATSSETTDVSEKIGPQIANASGVAEKSVDGGKKSVQVPDKDISSDSKAAGGQNESVTANNSVNFAAILDTKPLRTEHQAVAEIQTAQSQTDPHNIAGQIVEHAKLVNTAANSEMVIKLKPEHLGELTLKVVVESGAVSASFHSSNAEVRGVIENTLNQLRQEMSNQGIKVNYVGVYASLDHFSGKDQRGNNQQYQMAKVKTKRADNADFIEAVEATGMKGAEFASNGVDYRI